MSIPRAIASSVLVNSNGFFASIAYRADLQAQSVDLSPFIRYDINRIKMKANDILTSSETNTCSSLSY
jgi:hypothetical protein